MLWNCTVLVIIVYSSGGSARISRLGRYIYIAGPSTVVNHGSLVLQLCINHGSSRVVPKNAFIVFPSDC
jgi:hypothetical protein